MANRLLLLIAAMTMGAASAQAGPLEDLEPGHWYEIPGSHLRDVAGPHPGVGDVSCVMSCWAGGAFDTTRERLYVTGGGHAGYAGNEVYAFDLADLAWHRLNDFSPLTSAECPDAELAPCATHTYDQVEYLPPPVDRMIVSGCCMPHAYLFDPVATTWEVIDLPPDDPGGNTIGGISAFDPITGHYFAHSTYAGRSWDLDPVARTWVTQPAGSAWYLNYYYTAAIDPTRRKMIAVGPHAADTVGPADSIIVWTIDDLSTGGTAVVTTGDTAITAMSNVGLDYDSVSDRMVAWASGGDVYVLDLDAMAWERRSPLGDTTPGAPNMNGTYGRFRYVPSRNLFILVSSVDENVFVYRLGPGTGSGLPDAGPGGDAGPGADAGEPLPDGGQPSVDASASTAVDDGGCGCRASAGRGSPSLALLALAACAVLRRRWPSPLRR